MRTIFELPSNAKPMGDVRAGSCGGLMPWTLPIVEEYPEGFPSRYSLAFGHVTPVHPDGIPAPSFRFHPEGDSFSTAHKLAERWTLAQLGKEPPFPPQLLPEDYNP